MGLGNGLKDIGMGMVGIGIILTIVVTGSLLLLMLLVVLLCLL